MTAYFVENLTAGAWWRDIHPRLVRDGALRPREPGTLWFVDSTPAGEWLARRALAGTPLRLERFDFDAATMHDEAGKLVWLRIYYEDMGRALASICSEPSLAEALQRPGVSPRLAQYLRKQILPGAGVAQPAGLWRSLYLLHACLWKARRVQATGAVLFACRRPWLPALARYAREATGSAIVPAGARPALLPVLGRLLRQDLVVQRGRIRRLLRGDLSILRGASRVRPPACVALQYYGQSNVGRPELHSDFFFWQQSALPAPQVLALHVLPQDPLDAAREAELSAHGLRAAALTYEATTLGADRVVAPTESCRSVATALRIVVRRAVKPESWWLDAETQVFERRRRYWREVFRATGTRVFTTWFKYDSEHCAIAEALEDLGGVLAIYQRSFEGNPLAQGALACDVYFSFSRESAVTEAAAGSLVRHGVVTGYPGDHRFSRARAAAGGLRAELQAAGASSVVAFFDENSGEDPRWILGHEREQRHYAFLLERLLEDPRLGLVLKPKVPRTLRRRLGPVSSLLDRAIATGRCRVFQEGVLQGAVPPVQAALSADLVIHSSVAAATAGVEATLAGARVVLLDDDGWTISPLNALGRGRVIFEKAEALWHTWSSFREAPEAVPGFADWSPVLDRLDPFRDGRAAERMGNFLHWLIDGLGRGGAKRAVLDDAVHRYARAWGADKVYSIGT